MNTLRKQADVARQAGEPVMLSPDEAEMLCDLVDALAYGLRDRADWNASMDMDEAPGRWIDYDAEIGWISVRPDQHDSIAVPIADGWPEVAGALS